MKISVVIPTYNGERTLKRAIDSIISQQCEEVIFEILICDDLSTDNTLKIAKQYGCIILCNERHSGGPNAGRNWGIRKATGDLIAFLDQDDEWLPGKIAKQLVEIEKGAEFVSSPAFVRVE